MTVGKPLISKAKYTKERQTIRKKGGWSTIQCLMTLYVLLLAHWLSNNQDGMYEWTLYRHFYGPHCTFNW